MQRHIRIEVVIFINITDKLIPLSEYKGKGVE